jgi:hypothetical protein
MVLVDGIEGGISAGGGKHFDCLGLDFVGLFGCNFAAIQLLLP